MRGFFNLDGPFNKYGGMMADAMILSVLWFVFSIPIITMGAANTALFYVTTRRISEREGYIIRDFWHAFTTNFVRATKLWLIVLVVIFFTMFNLLNLHLLGNMSAFLFPLQILVLIQLSFISVFLFPAIARFDMGFKQTLKTCFYMANRHMLTSILCVALLAALIYGTLFYIFILVIFIPGTYAMLASYLIIKVFRKYRPEIDKDPMLEAQELEQQIAEDRRVKEFSSADIEVENEGMQNDNEV